MNKEKKRDGGGKKARSQGIKKTSSHQGRFKKLFTSLGSPDDDDDIHFSMAECTHSY